MKSVFYSSLDKVYKTIDRGEGVYVYDNEGNNYLDCAAGIAVSNIGYGVKEVIDAMHEQAKKITYVYGGTFTSEAKERLANQIIDLAPDGMEKVFFCSGGSEAVESIIKIARQYQIEKGNPSKYKIISRWQSYHGNTIATLSVGGRPSWREKYEPYLLHMPHIPQCNCLHCPYGLSYPSCKLNCAEALERVIKYEGPESVAAFLIEPVTGTTACATVPPEGYMQRIREICDKYDILFCVDEVITGLGRTGKAFAMNHFGVVPDMIAIAKGLGGGYVPIGAVVVHKNVVNAFEKGTKNLMHSFTYAGNPIACAGGSAVLKYIVDKDLISRSEKMGKIFLEKLKDGLGDLEIVSDVRGIGLLIGIEFAKDKETKEPFESDFNVCGKITKYCFDHNLIVASGISGTVDGIKGDALQLSPPFVIEEKDMDFAVATLRDAILDVINSIK